MVVYGYMWSPTRIRAAASSSVDSRKSAASPLRQPAAGYAALNFYLPTGQLSSHIRQYLTPY